MKSRWPFVAAITATVVLFFYNLSPITAQEVQSGASTNVFPNQALTNSYIFSTPLDLQSYDSLSVLAVPGTLYPGQVAKIKFQWTTDLPTATGTATNWSDESTLVAGASSGSELPYTNLTRVVQWTLASPTLNYIERERRIARYWRVGVQSTNVVTSATISIFAKPESNNN